jgi:hypothetical protein
VRRLLAPALVAALIASTAAWGKVLVGTPSRDRIVGTKGADLITPRGSADVIDARAGDDRVVAPVDDSVDAIACGLGQDLVLADLTDSVAPDCETVARQLSRDDSGSVTAQHETEVEPDSLSFGRTVVTAFQKGRMGNGGAAAIGWATSPDAGRTWRSGSLGADFPAVSDPSVGYDAVHGTWLLSFVALTAATVDVFVSRSPDGVTWSAPIPVAIAPGPDSGYDKDWIVCDDGPASAFRGRCYISYLDTGSSAIVTRASTDGGLTWGPAVGSRAGIPIGALVNGAMPVIRPNGDLIVLLTVFAPFGAREGTSVAATRSVDGGTTFSDAVLIADLDAEDQLGMRAPPLVSADVDRTGAVRVVWADCRFRDQCQANDVVLATSRDGVSWSPPVRVPMDDRFGRADAMVPAIAADGTKLAVIFYTLPQPNGCARPACRGLDAWLMTQTGGRWSRPLRLSPQAIPLDWLADGGIGAMVGDYISVSWAAGKPISVLALATQPESQTLREAIFAVKST